MKKNRRFSRDVAVQIMYQLELRGSADYAKLLSHYRELCDSGDYEEILRTFMDGFKPHSPSGETDAAGGGRDAEKMLSEVDGGEGEPETAAEEMRFGGLDSVYLSQLFEHYIARRDVVDESIRSNLRGWRFGRIAGMDLAVLRVALTEILFMDDIPPKSSVNEAVELAKRYGDEKSTKFVNGLLANYMR